MKSFIQFLEESYLNEDEVQGNLFTRAGKPQDFRNPKKIPFTATDPIKHGPNSPLPDSTPKPSVSPGQLSIPNPKTTKVPGSSVTGSGEARQGSLLTRSGEAQNFTGGRNPFISTDPIKHGPNSPVPKSAPKPSVSPGQLSIPGMNFGKPGDELRNQAEIARRKAAERASNPKPPSVSPTPTSPTRQTIQNTRTGTDVAKAATDTLGKGGKFAKWGGRALAGAGAALDAADEYKRQRERGRTRGSSAAMGVTKAAGGLAGAEAGASAGAALGGTIGSIVPGAGTAIGAGIGGVVGGIGGYMAGSGLAGRASEVVAGATGKEKAAMATANRQRQAGGALRGIGGPTSFDKNKNTMTTGVGSQRKTVQLAKTSVVTGPGGKQDTGYLAYTGGKAVYKRAADPSTLAKTSSNPLERIGRSLFAGAYKQSDAAAAAKKLSAARQSDTLRNRALGVKFKPGG